MNDPTLAVARLRDIIGEAHRDRSLAERSALYSAARYLLSDIRKHFTPEKGRLDGYMSEKIHKTRWHIAAALDFDIDNGHDDEQHRVWAYGSLDTLSSLINEAIAREDEEDD